MNTSSTSDRVQQLLCFCIAAHKQAQATQRGYRPVSLVKLASPFNDPLTLVSLSSLQQQSQSTLTTCTPTRSHQGYHALSNPHTLTHTAICLPTATPVHLSATLVYFPQLYSYVFWALSISNTNTSGVHVMLLQQSVCTVS